MIKSHIELIRDGQPQVLLSWHKHDENGNIIPIAMEFSDTVDDEMRQRIIAVCERPLNVTQDGKPRRAISGSSAHFGGLPKVLGRLGFRTRVF